MYKKVTYFAYGSNMSTNRMKKRIPSALVIGRAQITDKCLVFNKKSMDGSGKANLIDAIGNTVWGVLYEIDSVELCKLNEIEKGYKPILLDVLTDIGLLVKAYTYISSELTDDARPCYEYKELVLKGASEHNLPESYVKRIEMVDVI